MICRTKYMLDKGLYSHAEKDLLVSNGFVESDKFTQFVGYEDFELDQIISECEISMQTLVDLSNVFSIRIDAGFVYIK